MCSLVWETPETPHYATAWHDEVGDFFLSFWDRRKESLSDGDGKFCVVMDHPAMSD